MAKNKAIVIGINQYDSLQLLNYAKQDAQLMQEFLRNDAGFDQIFFFSDDSPPSSNGLSTRPNRANLLRVLRELFENPFLGAGDNFWFFFSGHGMRHADHDYLMPLDGDPHDIENTAIEITYITKRLRRCGADNVVLILDACRNLGSRSGEGIGNQTAEQARHTGVISIFSCTPNQLSYEIDTLKQGAFTYTLLEGLGSQGRCATVEQLHDYLTERVPQLNRQYGKPSQTPYTIAEPITKCHLILLPRYATVENITTLKLDAYRAAQNGDFNLAEQLWIRVNAATSGKDIEAVRELQKIGKNSTPSPESRDGNQNPPKPEDPPSKDQPKPNDKRKWPVTIGAGIVSTLALALVVSGMISRNRNSQPKVPPCSSTEDLCKIFPQVSDGKEETWSYDPDTRSNPKYKRPTYNYVTNDRECGGSSSPVLKLQYEFPDKKPGHSSGWTIRWDNGFDVSKFSTLDFEIKSASGSGNFGVGMVDIDDKKSKEDKPDVAPRDWKKISIPLSQIESNLEKSKIRKIYIAFLSQDGSGTICIDKIELR